MASFLFWNVNKKDSIDLVCDIANDLKIDVVILCENSIDKKETLKKLQNSVCSEFHYPNALPGKMQLFCRSRKLDLKEFYSGMRTSMRRLKIGKYVFLFGIVHLVDKRNFDERYQLIEAKQFADEVSQFEKQKNNQKTILVGDFNLNPFDPGMSMTSALNAQMTMECVTKGKRTIQGKDHPYFFNPMWSLMGERAFGPPGTFHHRQTTSGFPGWNMLDQVLIRPQALKWLGEVKILDTAGNTKLATKRGRPHRKYSDHFPITFEIRNV